MRYSSSSAAISGALLIAIFQVDTDSRLDYGYAAVTVLFLSVVTMLIQLIINYKCDSHNRLAAYRRLIGAEMVDGPDSSIPPPFIVENMHNATITQASKFAFARHKKFPLSNYNYLVSFDFCMSHLNEVYQNNEFRFEYFEKPKFGKKGIFAGMSSEEVEREVAKAFPRKVKFDREYADVPRDDEVSPFKWRDFFHQLITFSSSSGSWSFPTFVNGMMSAIVVGEFFFSFLLLINYYIQRAELTTIGSFAVSGLIFSVYTCLFLVFIHLFKSNAFFYHQLMFGSKTISSHFRRFLPYRLLYITTLYKQAEPFYIGTPWKAAHGEHDELFEQYS